MTDGRAEATGPVVMGFFGKPGECLEEPVS